MRERAIDLIVGGGQAHKRPYNVDGGSPAFVDRADGCRFWDVDGNEYIDYLMGYGPIVLGYRWPALDEAVKAQMAKGSIFNVEFPEELQLAEALIDLIPCAEKVAFFIGGSAATSGAVRIARAHTDKDVVLRCGYHGWHDWAVPDSPGVPQHTRTLIHAIPYNDLDALAAALKAHAGRVAAVIIEAVQGSGPDPDYFPGVERLVREHDAVFILDEVKTGFRFALGGAQAHLGIQPDLAVFGKAMCNGYAGSAVVGRKAVMESAEKAYMAATFHADPLSVAAGLATISELRAHDGIAHQWRLGRRLMDGLQRLFDDAGAPLSVEGYPVLASVVRSPDIGKEEGEALKYRFHTAMMLRGSYLHPHPWFLTLSHTEADIDVTLEHAQGALREAMR